MVEIELKLKLGVVPGDLPKLQDALLAMAGEARPARSTLTSTYYDTPDNKLRRRDLTLRVRKEGRRIVQTVKSHDAGDDNMLVRGEWEDDIPDEHPHLDAPRCSTRLKQAVQTDELRPLFTTVVTRTAINLEPRAGTRIEAALDKGEIRIEGGAAVAPLCELELELKSGDPALLYDLALRLLEVVPLRIETLSKSERGYRLAAGSDAKPPVIRSELPVLAPGTSVGAVLQSVGRRCLAGFLANESAALADLPEGVHQMRVALRRLRSMLSAVKPLLPPEHYRWAGDELRFLSEALGPARNWDVLSQSLIEPVIDALPTEKDLKRLAQAVDRRRGEARERAKGAIRSAHYTSAILKLLRWIESQGWRDQPVSEVSALLVAPIGQIAPQLIERRHRQALKRSRHLAGRPPKERHRLRIALKKLRYTIEFLGSLFGDDAAASYLRHLKSLQDDLGRVNDVRVAHDLLAELRSEDDHGALDRAGGIVLGWHSRILAEQEAKLGKHVREFRHLAPFW